MVAPGFTEYPSAPNSSFIHLENSIADLYASKGDEKEVLLVPIFTASCISLTPGLAKNTKYLVYENSTIETELLSSGLNIERQCHLQTIRRLTDCVHHFIFQAGPMTVSLMDPWLPDYPPYCSDHDDKLHPSRAHAEAQIAGILEVLSPEQRPKIQWVDDLKHLELKHNQVLAPIMALDDFENKPCILHPDLHYELASKESLALSGLKTPKSEIIRFDLLPPCLVEDCCSACQNQSAGQSMIPSTCTGPRRSWLDAQISTTVARIKGRPLPFVLKITQAMGSDGTFILRTPAELDDVIKLITNSYLPIRLPLLTPSNIHLKPINLVLQDYHPGLVFSVDFFIKKTGECVFMCCSEEKFGEGGRWNGARTVYSQQDSQENRMRRLVQSAGRHLRSQGYWGNVDIDVIDATDTTTVDHDADDTTITTCTKGKGEEIDDKDLWLIDINVRMGGGGPLGFLRPHFTSRGLDWATFLLLPFRGMTRSDFQGKMGAEIEQGSVVIVAWFEYMQDGGLRSNGRFAVAGKDEAELESLENKVRALAA